MNAREVAEIAKLIKLTETATKNAMSSIQHYQLEGMKMGFEMMLLLASDAEAYALEKAKLQSFGP